jgi:hypothetical protein
MPLLVACWPFKITQKYAIKGVQLVMNTFFNYVMLGIVLLIGVEIVDFATGKKNGTMDAFMEAMNNNNIIKLQEMTSIDGIEILILVACCIFAFKLIENTNRLADKFSKGSGMNIASKIGGVAASAAVSAAATGGSVIGSVGGAIAEETGISQALSGARQDAHDFVMKGASTIGKAVGLGEYQPKKQTSGGSPTSSGDGGTGGGTNGGGSGGTSGGNGGGSGDGTSGGSGGNG